MILSAMLKQHGHEVEMFISEPKRNIVRDAAAFRPDLAAFSCTTGAHRWVAQTAADLKKAIPQVVTVAGGPHPTFYPNFIQEEGMDVICRGEGEYAIVELAAAIDDSADFSSIQNLHIKTRDGVVQNGLRPPVADLDSLPFPDRSLYYDKYEFMRKDPDRLFLTSRGCPYKCSFCFNHAMDELYGFCGGMPLRRMSPAHAIEMLERTKRDYGIEFIIFDDDLFILDKKWLREFLALFRKQIKRPFSCLVRANLMTEDIARELARAGCRSAQFGVESGNERLRLEVLNKKITDEQLLNTARMLKKNGIRICTFNMLNLPGETVDDAFQTIALNHRMGVDEVWCALVMPYPGTRIEQIAREMRLLPDDFSVDHIPVSYFKESPIRNPEKSQLENLHKFFPAAVKTRALWPIIRALITLPPNPTFDLVFKIFFGLRYRRIYQAPLLHVFRIGQRNKKQF